MRPLVQYTPSGTSTVQVLSSGLPSMIRRISINNSGSATVTVAVYMPPRAEAAAQANAILGPFVQGRGTTYIDYTPPLTKSADVAIHFSGSTACTLLILGD